MRSKIFFFNKGLFFSNLKRFAWTAVLETLVLFLSMPLPWMMETFWLDGRDIMRYSSWTIFPNLTFCVFPVVLAVLLFGYLHKPKMTTAMHGLPVSRMQMYFSTIASGLALIAIPIVINVAMIGIINVTTSLGAYNIYMSSVLRWAAYGLLLCMVLFAFTTFIGMFVGNPAGQLVFTYIVHFLPLALFAIYMALCQLFFYGFDSSFDIPRWMLELPMMTIGHEFTDPCWYYLLLFAVLGVLFFALALFVYKKRPLEHAGDVVVFGWLKPVFKYGLSVCAAAVGFLYITGITGIATESNLVGNTLIAVVWAAIGFCIAQMLIAKTWRIFTAYKEMLGVCAVVAVFFVAFQCDIFGFETRMVAPEEVASVQISYYSDYPENAITLSEPENIRLVTQLHERALQEREERDYVYTYTYMHIEYRLKDGTTMRRSYDIRESQLLRDLTNAEETVRAGYPMLYDGKDRIISIRYKDLYINNKEALIAAMRKDIESKGETVPAAEPEILGIDADAKPMVGVELTENPYYIEFEMYKTEEQMQENGSLYADYSGKTYYHIRVTPEEMPVTFALLSSPDFL